MPARPIRRSSLRVACAFACSVVAGTAVAAQAAPTLRLRAEQHQQPAKLNLSPIQLWDTEWWLLVEATPNGSALTRIEYRTSFLDERPQSHAGGIDIQQVTPEPIGGRVQITLPTRNDYERRFRIRTRVIDASGDASEWAIMDFPPEKSIRPDRPGAYEVSTKADVARKHTLIGTVEYEATDATPLRVVRDELGRRARAAGGDAAVGVRLVRSTADTFVFGADVLRYLEVAKPTPTAVSLATDRRLGEIVVPYERR